MTETLTSESLRALLQQIDNLNVCCGQPDLHFVSMVKCKKGKNVSIGGQTNITSHFCGYFAVYRIIRFSAFFWDTDG